MEADQELANIEPQAEGLIYHFLGEDWKFTREELNIIFSEHSLPQEKYDEVIGFLLYFGFFGIRVPRSGPLYIFDVGYDMNRLNIPINKHAQSLEYTLNAAFWPALGVTPDLR